MQRIINALIQYRNPILYFFLMGCSILFLTKKSKYHKTQLEEFIKIIKDKSAPKVNFEDGRRALIIANAAYESLNTGKVIDIEFD